MIDRPQHFDADGMECPNVHQLCHISAEQLLKPLFQLACSLIGEGDDQESAGVDSVAVDHLGCPRYHRTCLSTMLHACMCSFNRVPYCTNQVIYVFVRDTTVTKETRTLNVSPSTVPLISVILILPYFYITGALSLRENRKVLPTVQALGI